MKRKKPVAKPPARKAMKMKAKGKGMSVQPDGKMEMSPPADQRGKLVSKAEGKAHNKKTAKKKGKLGGHKGY